jgi:hypothetical protein
MADYRAYIVGEDGHFLDCEARPCKDDRAAIEWAKQLVDGRAIELWCAERFVVKLEPPKRPFEVPKSGPTSSHT